MHDAYFFFTGYLTGLVAPFLVNKLTYVIRNVWKTIHKK